MLELWAKKREYPKYEYITSFEHEEQKYYMIDQLDRSIYKEAMVLQKQHCALYREFEEPMVRRLKK